MDELAINPDELAELMGSENNAEKPSAAEAEESIPADPTAAAEAVPTGGTTAVPQEAEPQPQMPPPATVTARPAEFAPLQNATMVSSSTNLDMLLGVTLQVTVEIGRTTMSVEEVLQIGAGSVLELDRLAGEPVDVLVNNQLIARGEVVVVDDRFAVRITDVLPPAQRLHSLP